MRKGLSACNFFRKARLIFSVMILAIFVLILQKPDSLADNNSAQECSIDFTTLSLEELKNVEIISVSKKPEKVSQAAAAVFVITQEDIRRSGVTRIPEALRLAPGVQVARVNTHGWAISVRGFNEIYSNKLLVLIDGRSVYTPIFSGVFWDVQDTMIEDIERIEVIRGPGSALWGANAVNGVINIITRNANKTQGGLISAGGYEHGFVSIRYGDVLGNGFYYRVYGKYSSNGHLDNLAMKNWKGHGRAYILKEDVHTDDWHEFRGGFRVDRKLENTDSFTLQGEAYADEDDMEMDIQDEFCDNQDDMKTESYHEDSRIEGMHLLGRWDHTFSEKSDTVLQIYFDHTERDSMQAKFSINTFDLDFQHWFAPGLRHEITWGLGYRFISDQLDNFSLTSFDPGSRDQHLFSAFIQDEVQLVEDRLRLTVGSKFEHNDFTGSEIQPSIRFLWTPRERHSLWGSVSRAVRVPARSEYDGIMLIGPIYESANPESRKASAFEPGDNSPEQMFFTTSELGNDSLDSEDVIAFEVGYRLQPADRLWLDIAAFYNYYRGLQTKEKYKPGIIRKEWDMILQLIKNEWDNSDKNYLIKYLDNKMDGKTYGIEAAADWQITDQWNLRTSYSYLQMCMNLNDSTDNTSKLLTEGSSPHHQFSLRSSLDITKQTELDLWLRYVGDLPAKPAKSYVTLDARLAWRPFEELEFSLTGQNLLDKQHPEFSVLEVERSVYGKVTWRF